MSTLCAMFVVFFFKQVKNNRSGRWCVEEREGPQIRILLYSNTAQTICLTFIICKKLIIIISRRPLKRIKGKTFHFGGPSSAPGRSPVPIGYRRAATTGHLGTCSPPCWTRPPNKHRGGGGRATWLGPLRLRGQVGQDGYRAWREVCLYPTRNRAG